jgi:hypothetical protein
MKYLYKKLSSTKGIVYNKIYRLRLLPSSDSQQLISNKPTKVLGQFVSDTANPKWILQTLK